MGVKDIDKRRKEVGRVGESVAADFLARKGFAIIARNYRKPWGEIDIIAEKAGIVRFVEVKTLSKSKTGAKKEGEYRPEEQVHPFKLKKIARTAELYMNATRDRRDFQIDVVGVYLNHQTRTAYCRLFEQVL